MDPKERHAFWERKIEECFSSSMNITQWCELNKIHRQTFYKWLKCLREEDPDRFSIKNNKTSNWIELSSDAIKQAKALVPASAKPKVPNGPEPKESELI